MTVEAGTLIVTLIGPWHIITENLPWETSRGCTGLSRVPGHVQWCIFTCPRPSNTSTSADCNWVQKSCNIPRLYEDKAMNITPKVGLRGSFSSGFRKCKIHCFNNFSSWHGGLQTPEYLVQWYFYFTTFNFRTTLIILAHLFWSQSAILCIIEPLF